MAHVFKDLLQSNHPLFIKLMHDLESTTGHEGVDVRLIADITHKQHKVMRLLGLDPADTTARELYLALNSHIEKNNSHEEFFSTDYVIARIGTEIVSLNYIDMVENAHHQLAFEKRHTGHGQRSLRGEILQRYLDHPRTNAESTQQLALDAGLLVHDDATYTSSAAHLIQDKAGTNSNTAPYVLAIGDIFTDAFIELDKDVARIDTDDDGSKRISLPLGSKPPYDGVEIIQAVGPSPNAAVSIARLGLRAGLDSFIGDDEVGREAINYLQSEGVSTDTMLIEKGIKTSYYFVLRYGAERTILVKNEQFDYKWDPPAEVPSWIYLALLSDASWEFHERLADYLDDHEDIKFAFQPGTFHFKWGIKKLKRIYARSHIIVLNREEAVDITGESYDSIKSLADGLHKIGPKIVVITDGASGSYASYDDKLVQIPNYPDPGPPVDRTGAGDAFASTIVAALALGESMDTALTWAPINSMNVVQHIGAQAGLLSREQIDQYLKDAPKNYKVTEYQDD